MKRLLGFLVLTPLVCFADTQTFNASGTWEAPSGVTSVTVECWGGGGGGSGAIEGGGGGGGAYSKLNSATVVPGNTYTVTVGTAGNRANPNAFGGGDSWFNTAGTVIARGGAGATSGTGRLGGQSSIGVGDTKFSGGNGGNSNVSGGGGGSSAGTAANGGNGSNGDGSGAGGGAGGSAPSGGGAGGSGGADSDAPVSGTAPGGGGGGVGQDTSPGGNGAAGRVILTWTVSTQTPGKKVGTNGILKSHSGVVKF